jgi:hypothetical protein
LIETFLEDVLHLDPKQGISIARSETGMSIRRREMYGLLPTPIEWKAEITMKDGQRFNLFVEMSSTGADLHVTHLEFPDGWYLPSIPGWVQENEACMASWERYPDWRYTARHARTEQAINALIQIAEKAEGTR